MPIVAWLLSKISVAGIGAIFGQIASIYAKSKDDKLAALQAVVGAEVTNNTEYARSVVETNRVKAAASHSIVALTVVAVFCLPAAIHAAMWSLAMAFPLGWESFVGELSDFEKTCLTSFLFIAPSLPVLSVGAQAIAKKL